MNATFLKAELSQTLTEGRSPTIAFLQIHPWLLIPDVRPRLLKDGFQGCYQNVSVADCCRADFVAYEIHDGRIHWQLTCIASPNDSILKDGDPSPEFRQSSCRVELWQDQFNSGKTPFAQVFPDRSAQFSFRIVIGRSRNQTPAEQREVQLQRRGDLRIRSFDWLTEKPSHYSDADITTLESCGPARTAFQWEQDVSELAQRISRKC